MEDKRNILCDLANSAIFSDVEWSCYCYCKPC